MDIVRLVLVDDHPCVLAGLKELMLAEKNICVCGSANTAAQGLQLIRDEQPDVAIIDLSLPDFSGIELARRISALDVKTRLIAFTFHSDELCVKQAIAASVRGYVLKSSDPEGVLHAVRSVADGGVYVDPKLTADLITGRRESQDRAADGQDLSQRPVSDREVNVLRLTAFGYSCKEIARQINISPKSAETYKARAVAKLGLENRADIIRFAVRQGWFGTLH